MVMNIAVDKFGRVVLPKIIRNHFGLRAGSELELEETEGTIVLRVIDERSLLEMDNGVLVFTGKSLGNMEDVLFQVREERLQDLSGGFN